MEKPKQMFCPTQNDVLGSTFSSSLLPTSCVRKIPQKRKWQPTPVFLPRKFHEQRSLVGYSPWGCKELDKTEHACQKAEVFGKWLKTERGKQFKDSCLNAALAVANSPPGQEWEPQRWVEGLHFPSGKQSQGPHIITNNQIHPSMLFCLSDKSCRDITPTLHIKGEKILTIQLELGPAGSRENGA